MTLEHAKIVLKEHIQADGSLYSLGHYLAYTPGEGRIILDDQFDSEELEAIVVYMQSKGD